MCSSDLAAKVLADNLTALLCGAAEAAAGLPERQRKCIRAYAIPLVQGRLPKMLLGLLEDLVGAIDALLQALARAWQRYRPGRSRPRKPAHVKPHPSAVYKG